MPQTPQLIGLPTAGAGNDLVETGSAPLRRLQPALVSTELLRYNVVLTVGAGQRRLLTLDEERKLLPKEKVLSGEGTARAA